MNEGDSKLTISPLRDRHTVLLAAGLAASTVLAGGGYLARVGNVGPARSATSFGSILVDIGLIGLCLAWLRLGTHVRRGGLDSRGLTRTALLWAAPLVIAPAMFSHDLHSYAAQGTLVLAGLNPYHHGPADLGFASHLARSVDPVWRHSTVPYGPFVLALSTIIVWLVQPLGATALVVALRLPAIVGLGLVTRAIPRLARAHGVSPTLALWLTVLNPLALIHLVGGGHNDALMLGLLLTGLALETEDQPMAALVCCALAGMVKAPALAGAGYVMLAHVRAAPAGRARVAAALASAGAVLATIAAVTVAAHLGTGWVGALSTPAQVHVLLTPVTLMSGATTRIAHGIGLHLHYRSVLQSFRAAGILAAGLVAVGLALRPLASPARSTALALLALVLLGPVVQPWYLLWGTFLIAPSAPWRWSRLIIVPSVLFSFAVRPSGHAAPQLFVVALVLAAVVATVIIAGGSTPWRRSDPVRLRTPSR